MVMQNWKLRYFVLSKQTLYYYKENPVSLRVSFLWACSLSLSLSLSFFLSFFLSLSFSLPLSFSLFLSLF
jgi:hypothetical protein